MLAAYTSTPPLSGSSHELYLMLGTSSAALVGLLFVATSLHLAEIANEDLYRLRAQYTTLILLSTLLVAIAVLMPQPLWILESNVLRSIFGDFRCRSRFFQKRSRIPGARGRGGFSVRRSEFFIAGFVVGIVGSGVLAAGRESGMFAITVSYASLLVASIWNGWMIMQGIGRGERLRK